MSEISRLDLNTEMIRNSSFINVEMQPARIEITLASFSLMVR